MDLLPRAVAVINQGIEANLHIGAQLYVSVAGKTIANLAIGEARDGVPLRTDHLMLWMSSCKPITAIAIAKLWEKGKLGLDDRIAEHIPEFAAGGKERISIRHVLTHTGGFPAAALSWTADPWDAIIAQTCASPLESGWTPGVDSGYHVASGWYVLGEIVRRLDGRDYPQYVREEILEPLGMKDSWLGMQADRHRAYDDRIVPMHLGAIPNEKPQPFGSPTVSRFPIPAARFWSESAEACGLCRPGGSARGPICELAKFYEAMLEGGGAVISPQTIEALTTRHTINKLDRTFGYALDRGLGFVIDSKRHGRSAAWYGTQCSERTFGHAGAWSSVAFADPEHKLVVALVHNGMTAMAPAKNDHRAIATLDGLYEDLGL